MPDAHAKPELSPDHVRRVAELSRLELTDAALEDHRRKLSAVITYVERLRTLDLANVQPMAHVGDALNRPQGDEPGPTLPTEVLMRMAPDPEPPFLRVPKVVE